MERPEWIDDETLRIIEDAMPETPSRDYVYCLQLDFSIDDQLGAIRTLLRLHRDAEQLTTQEIKETDDYARKATGLANDYACDRYVELCHTSVYQDGAHSMAALGMLAPLIETIFYQCFLGIRAEFFSKGDPANKHPRWEKRDEDRWDCHKIISGKRWHTNLVQGIIDLSDAVGVGKHWPANLETVLAALFAYRNKMFHHGFEWPLTERKAFAERIKREGWDAKWFSSATSGDVPWVFYLTNEFIDEMFAIIDQVIEGFGVFIRDELLPAKRKS